MSAGRRGRIRRPSTAAAAALSLVALSACGGAGEGPSGTEEETAQEQTLTVYAAASLTESFQDIAEQFEAQHPGVDVQLQFAGSATLLSQLQEGAPADVLATADERSMDQAVDSDLVAGDPSIFAANTLTIAVPQGNPGGVESFADLAQEATSTVICEERVPCGAATVAVEDLTGVQLSPVSEESSVTDVLGKVTSGQADAGVVYRTDAASAGDQVEEIEIPEADDAVNRYPIAVLQDAQNPELAQEFSGFVRGQDGQQRLADEGFGAP